ncbi:SHOCT domain-containing protein [Kitasatospora sp. NPDC056273]
MSPEQLLAERFARGEIDAEEYRHRLDTLRSANGPGGD